MAEWSELEANWDALRSRLAEEKEKLSPREQGVIYGFANEVYQVVATLRDLEEKIEKGGPNPPAFGDLFKGILNGFHFLGSGGPSAGAEAARRLMNQIWDYGIGAMTSFLERKAEAVGVDSWSIGVTGGFPTGISATVQVTFRRS